MYAVSLAIIKLVSIAMLGFYLYRRSSLDDKVLNFLNEFVINFTVPFLIFSHLVENGGMVRKNSLFLFLGLSFLVFFVGVSIGYVYALVRGVSPKVKREFISLVTFQNCGYLPMNLVYMLLTGKAREHLLIYIFLYMLGFNIMMWSIGSYLIFRKRGERFDYKTLFTPPVTATLLGLVLIFSGGDRFVPLVILAPVRMVGDMSFALSMIILGACLAKVDFAGYKSRLKILLEANFIKLVVIPFCFLLLMLKFDKLSLIGFFVVFEASMPSAASLLLIANLKKADSSFIAQSVFLSHILSIITIPAWGAVFIHFSGPLF